MADWQFPRWDFKTEADYLPALITFKQHLRLLKCIISWLLYYKGVLESIQIYCIYGGITRLYIYSADIGI